MSHNDSDRTEQETASDGCPADGCSGAVTRTLIGDAANPRTRVSCDTCNSDIEHCDKCGERAVHRELNAGPWTERGQIAAQDRQLWFCDECYEEEGYNL